MEKLWRVLLTFGPAFAGLGSVSYRVWRGQTLLIFLDLDIDPIARQDAHKIARGVRKMLKPFPGHFHDPRDRPPLVSRALLSVHPSLTVGPFALAPARRGPRFE